MRQSCQGARSGGGATGGSCKVTDSTQSAPPVQNGPQFIERVRALGGRFVVISVSVLLMLGGAIGGYLLGNDMAMRPLADAKSLIERLQPENQRLKQQVLSQNTTIDTLQSHLASAQATLNSMMPSENTYNINANQSLIVAGGHLTIGLIGPPTNQSITLNINGNPHVAVSGEAFTLSPDPATNCQVRVQSFDMFSAAVNATCAAKPH